MRAGWIDDRVNLPGLALLVVLALVWEVAGRLADNVNFPPLHAVLMELWANLGTLATQMAISLRRAATGFALALAIALPLGIVLGRVRWLGDVVTPVIDFLRPLPPIAVVPIAMVFLGVGDGAKLVVIVYGAVFPVLVNAYDAVRAQDPMQARVARSLRLTAIERMALVDLPAALPQIMAGVRLSLAVALLLTVVAELILSTDGIGHFLLQNQSAFNVTGVLATLLVIAVCAVAVNALAQAVTGRLLAWNVRRSALAELGR